MARRAIGDDLLRGDLVSATGRTLAIVVSFDEQRVDDVRPAVLNEIRAIVTRHLPSDFVVHYNGSIEINEEYSRITLANQSRFTPPILLLTLIAMYVMFRSWKRTFVTMGAVLVSVIWTLGLYSLLGFSYNVLSSMIVPLIVVLAIADDVHIVQHYDEYRRRCSAKDAFISTVSHLLMPLLGASGTTALGMLSLATSNIVAVRQFGMGSAVGVMVDFVISLVLMPTVLGWIKPAAAPPPQEAWFKTPLLSVARLSTTHYRAVLAVVVVLSVIAGVGMARVRVDTNHLNFFSPSHPLSRSADVIDNGAERHLFLPGAPRRAAGLDEAARRPRAHGPPRGGDPAVAARPQSHWSSRVRQARPSRAQR